MYSKHACLNLSQTPFGGIDPDGWVVSDETSKHFFRAHAFEEAFRKDQTFSQKFANIISKFAQISASYIYYQIILIDSFWFYKISWNFVDRKIAKNQQQSGKFCDFLSRIGKCSANFNEKLRLENDYGFQKRCKGAHCVDLGESFQTHIYLHNLASIPPRTSPPKFGWAAAANSAGYYSGTTKVSPTRTPGENSIGKLNRWVIQNQILRFQGSLSAVLKPN